MTAGTPMSGPDTGAAFKGLIVGLIAIMIVVVSIVMLTNKKFESHEAPTVQTP